MASGLEKILEQLEQAQSLEELQNCTVALRDHYEVDHAVYHWVSSDGEQYGCGTYTREWVQHYLEMDYLRVDPVITGCWQRFHPVDWRQLDWTPKSVKQFLAESIAYGIGNQGFSVPIRGPNGQYALFTLSHNGTDEFWDAFTEKNRRDIILIAHILNQKGLEFEKGRVAVGVRALSPREIDALTLLAMGYSRGQAAGSLSISEHTLRVYIEGARFKLNAMNTTHAVALAMSHGLIVVGATSPNAVGGWPKDAPEKRVS